MRTHHPDFVVEQEAIERAYDCHEQTIVRQRELIAGHGNAGADRHAQRAIRDMAVKKLDKLLGIDTKKLVFGRLDFQDPERHEIYVGPTTIRSDEQVLVVDFTRDIARGYYYAKPDAPLGLTRRRTFDANRRELLDISDEVFAALRDAALAEEGPTRTVLDGVAAELEQAREPHMRQIVATIVADQYRMIEAPAEGIFVIQGGPGTGKTAVALHRAVFLIRRNEGLGKVLVVGPNAAFMAYIAAVLPGLGERDVDQVSIDRLAATGDLVRVSGNDPRLVAAIKGDAKMADVVKRAIEQRIRPASDDLVLRSQNLTATFPAADANEILEVERSQPRPYMDGRSRFIDAMRTAAEDVMEARLSRFARIRGLDRQRFRLDLSNDREWNNSLERMWPTASAAGVIHDLLTTEQRLRDVSSGLLRETDIPGLVRRDVRTVGVHPWTRADLPLIDEAGALLQGPQATYGYVIVDEAQDLTPMELRMVARRSRAGDMTLVGDIAQATGPFRHADWDAIISHLPQGRGVTRDELRVGYRVPRSIMDLANLLLPRIAPDLRPTEPVREARLDPAFARVGQDELAETVAGLVGDLVGDERSTGIVTPAVRLVDIRGALAAAAIPAGDISTDQLEKSVTLLTSSEAKGLEFDRVIVVEPMNIVTDSPTGWSELYVALTRATQQLTVVHSLDLPAPLPGGVEPEFPPEPDDPRHGATSVDDDLDSEVSFDLDVDLDLDLDEPVVLGTRLTDSGTGLTEPAESLGAKPGTHDAERTRDAEPGTHDAEPAEPVGAETDTHYAEPGTNDAEPGTHDAEPAEPLGAESGTHDAEPADLETEASLEVVVDHLTADPGLEEERVQPVRSAIDPDSGSDSTLSAERRGIEPPEDGGAPSVVRQVRRVHTTLELGGDFSEALVLAKLTHGGTRRRGTAIPYVSHLLGTAALVLEDGGDETEAIAALLHDAVEDGPPGIEATIRRRFGPAVADIVIECTDVEGGTYRERKLEHLRRLEAGSRSARRVALAEKLDNARALLRDLERYGAETWKAMGVEQGELIWYVQTMAAFFSRTFPSVLALELARAVEEIDRLAGLGG